MANLLIRNVSNRTAAALKARARRHGRSMQAEALAIIENAARPTGDHLADTIHTLMGAGKLRLNIKAALAALREDRAR